MGIAQGSRRPARTLEVPALRHGECLCSRVGTASGASWRSCRDTGLEGGLMADPAFVWDDLAKFKAEGRFLDGYPSDERTFFAPRDHIHDLLVALVGSAQHSIVVNMFGYDDPV